MSRKGRVLKERLLNVTLNALLIFLTSNMLAITLQYPFSFATPHFLVSASCWLVSVSLIVRESISPNNAQIMAETAQPMEIPKMSRKPRVFFR